MQLFSSDGKPRTTDALQAEIEVLEQMGLPNDEPVYPTATVKALLDTITALTLMNQTLIHSVATVSDN